MDKNLNLSSNEMMRIINTAIWNAVEENRRLGIPNAFERNGRIYYEMPDGTITTEDPFKES